MMQTHEARAAVVIVGCLSVQTMRIGVYILVVAALLTFSSAFTSRWGGIALLKPAGRSSTSSNVRELRCAQTVQVGEDNHIHERIKEIIANNDVVLFMKGEKNRPQWYNR